MVIPVWQSQIDMIERGLRHGQGDDVSSFDILGKVLTGENILWVVHHGSDVIAIVVLSVIKAPKKTKLFVELIAGRDMPLWYDQVQELLVDFKDVIGADCIQSCSRPGMVKYMSKTGWSKKATIMELI
jgi:hypothetical protein